MSITTVKKLAAYHQYYAVNAAVESTLRAADLQAEPSVTAAPSTLSGRRWTDKMPGRWTVDQRIKICGASASDLRKFREFYREFPIQQTVSAVS